MNIIETIKLTKLYGGFTANDSIDFKVEEGESHAVVGENGAGKSTLMNMLYGLQQPSSGDILIRGEKVVMTNPRDAISIGIGMVHQHFKLVPSFTIYENIMLGNELTRFGKVDRKKEIEVINHLIEKYEFRMNPQDRICDISVGMQQKVEILKMLYRNVDILILDEPTAVLTPQEVDELITNLVGLKKNGKTIVIITHKLSEVKACSDSLTVIRRGRLIDRLRTDTVSEKDIARLMVGRDVLLRVEKQEQEAGEEVLSAADLTVKDHRGINLLNNVSFNVRRGEILGFAGVEGNGQSELVKVLTGLIKTESGKLIFKGGDITNISADRVRQIGIGIIPEDRYREGLCKEMTVSENIAAGYQGCKPYSSKGIMDIKATDTRRDALIEEYDIRVGDPEGTIAQLSGGNAQKVIIARELSMNPDLIIACQPTRGVDIASIEFIHKSLLEMRKQGKAIVLITSELSDVMSLSDRIAVLYKGEIIDEVSASGAEKEELGLLMAGLRKEGTNDN